jgi:hypothetical protein
MNLGRNGGAPADIIKLAVEMRTAQKSYFRERSQSVLVRSKELERQFDQAARDFLQGGASLLDQEKRRT